MVITDIICIAVIVSQGLLQWSAAASVKRPGTNQHSFAHGAGLMGKEIGFLEVE